MLILLLQLSLFVSEPCVAETVKDCVVPVCQNYEVKSTIQTVSFPIPPSEGINQTFCLADPIQPLIGSKESIKPLYYTSGFV